MITDAVAVLVNIAIGRTYNALIVENPKTSRAYAFVADSYKVGSTNNCALENALVSS